MQTATAVVKSAVHLDTSVPDWVIEHGESLPVFQELGNNYNQHAPLLSPTAAVPEPSSLALVAFGPIGLLLAARRKR